MSRVLLSCALLAGLALPALAQESREPAKGTPSETQDLIFFGATRPVLLRLHLYIDGDPLGVHWEKSIKRRFDYADRNKDGELSESELKRFPTPPAPGYPAQPYQPNPSPPLSEIDANEDGKVTLSEATGFLLKKGHTPVLLGGIAAPNYGQMMGGGRAQPYYQQQVSYANQLTEALFKRLDADKDGKLSKQELAAVDKKLVGLDDDDDETIDGTELLQQGGYDPYGYYRQVQQVGQPAMPATPATPDVAKKGGTSFALVPRDDAASRLTQRLAMAKELITRYDKDNSGKVTREEIGLPKKSFEQLDKDSNDVLDQFELLRWVLLTPDVEIVVRLGNTKEGEQRVGLGEKKGVLSEDTSRISPRAMALRLPGTQIEVAQLDTQPYARSARNFNYLVQQFTALNREGKKFLDKKTVQQTPQYRIFQAIFDLADADADGRLTEKELQEYGDVQAEGQVSAVSLNIADVGRALFDLLDANKDGRLSRREMTTTADRLLALDDNKDGSISKEEITYQFRATAAVGMANQVYYQDPRYYQQPGQRPTPTAGPTWFRKMDANNDGELSQREFLGSPKDFAALDVNNDSVITLEEADTADSKLRTKTTRGN